jgi:hypothetical protein
LVFLILRFQNTLKQLNLNKTSLAIINGTSEAAADISVKGM